MKAGVRELLADLSDREPPRLPLRLKASAAAFPEGRIAGTRVTVRHRRRIRVSPTGDPDKSTAAVAAGGAVIRLAERLSSRDVAEVQFARLSKAAAEPA